MDHYFQIFGDPARDMLEAYTTLGFVAGQTSRVKLGTLVTGVTYRHPGILAKTVSTLDVLSGGRAYLGIGAAWFDREHKGLGMPFPPLKERFERLEEALQIAKQMWSDEDGAYNGKHYQLAETLDVPHPLTKPHPPILIGGTGEKKMMRLVAKYGDAINLIRAASPDEARAKFVALREACEKAGRNYDEIERTVYVPVILSEGNSPAQVVEALGQWSEAGVQAAIGFVANVEQIAPIETIGRDIIPQIKDL